ncbi:nuclear factor 7, brain-like [Rhinoraja longicauda]
MASKHQIQSLTEEAICPICLDFFTDPVILECGHNFCRSCITQSWDKEGRNSCPECREEIADRTLKVNRALASITETARALSLNTGGKERKLHCEEHQEVSCVAAREHKSHSFIPIKEAVEIYKEETRQKRRISDDINTLSVADGAVDVGKHELLPLSNGGPPHFTGPFENGRQ